MPPDSLPRITCKRFIFKITKYSIFLSPLYVIIRYKTTANDYVRK